MACSRIYCGPNDGSSSQAAFRHDILVGTRDYLPRQARISKYDEYFGNLSLGVSDEAVIHHLNTELPQLVRDAIARKGGLIFNRDIDPYRTGDRLKIDMFVESFAADGRAVILVQGTTYGMLTTHSRTSSDDLRLLEDVLNAEILDK